MKPERPLVSLVSLAITGAVYSIRVTMDAQPHGRPNLMMSHCDQSVFKKPAHSTLQASADFPALNYLSSFDG